MDKDGVGEDQRLVVEKGHDRRFTPVQHDLAGQPGGQPAAPGDGQCTGFVAHDQLAQVRLVERDGVESQGRHARHVGEQGQEDVTRHVFARCQPLGQRPPYLRGGIVEDGGENGERGASLALCHRSEAVGFTEFPHRLDTIGNGSLTAPTHETLNQHNATPAGHSLTPVPAAWHPLLNGRFTTFGSVCLIAARG